MPSLRILVPLVCALVLPWPAAAQIADDADQSPWRHLTIEELLELDVTTAARRPDPILTTAAPVQVLTRDDLHRAGIRYLAEAFRLADAMYVGRLDGRNWVVNTRGLAINGANKMQVMIDGRSIYSPLYSGVFWDAQDVLLEDVDRIEIIRGPGASLWGSNAVHGIVNVVTRRASDTTGTYASFGSGTEERAIAEFRHGARISDAASWRVYAKYGYRDAQTLPGGGSARDPMRRGQAGGRYDRQLGGGHELTVQGDAYSGRLGLISAADTEISGANLLARWAHRTTRGVSQVQTFYDRVHRHVPDQFGERRNTFDIDAQHLFSSVRRHAIVVGGGYRVSSDVTDETGVLFFDPRQRRTFLYNLFAQDEITLGGGLYATAGAKVEHNSFSGIEVQPTGRLRLTRGRQTVWGAVSRAVRLPTRLDTDARVDLPVLTLRGGGDFGPEELIAYEAGVRSQLSARVSGEASVFLNSYDDLRSQEQVGEQAIAFGNTIGGRISGIEVAATWQPTLRARVHGSYTFLHREIAPDPGSRDITGGEGNDAPHLATFQLFTDLRPNLRVNLVSRYIGTLPNPRVPAYAEADVTLQWDVQPWAEISLVGQNLLHERHPEFASTGTWVEEFDRSVYVTLTIRRQR